MCFNLFINLAVFTELELFEDGPYGYGKGAPWTDVDTFMENGPLTAIEIRAGGAIDGLRARYSTILLLVSTVKSQPVDRCTEVRFASLLSGGFTTMVVINLMEEKLANSTSVWCTI